MTKQTKYYGNDITVSDPSDDFKALAESNNKIDKPKWLYVGTAGDLVIEDASGETITFKALGVGYHPIRPTKILPASTCGDIVGAY